MPGLEVFGSSRPPVEGVKIIQTDPALTLDEYDKWSRLFEGILLRRAGT